MKRHEALSFPSNHTEKDEPRSSQSQLNALLSPQLLPFTCPLHTVTAHTSAAERVQQYKLHFRLSHSAITQAHKKIQCKLLKQNGISGSVIPVWYLSMNWLILAFPQWLRMDLAENLGIISLQLCLEAPKLQLCDCA